MLGAIAGDIIGSRFEGRRRNVKTKDFDLFAPRCRFTDDSVMSLAIARALLDCNGEYEGLSAVAIETMQRIGRQYPHAGYGGMFKQWIFAESPAPYGSYGNGAAMRVSACGFAARTLDEAISMSRKVTEVTHSHPEGIKGAEATAVAVFLARNGADITAIRDHIDAHYYPMDFTIGGIRDSYTFDVSCQGSVPQGIMAFLESTSFEDAIRNAVSIGGDSDTIAAIAGGMAEAHHGIPRHIALRTLGFLDSFLIGILADFEEAYAA